MCLTLSAQYSHQLIKVGKKYVLEHQTLNNNPDNLLIFAVLSNRQSSKIKFQTALIRLAKGQKPVIENIDLEPVEDQKEENILVFRQLKDNKILLITQTERKKENAVIMRIFSEKGQLLKSDALTLSCYNTQTRFVYNGGDEFYVSYMEYGTKTSHITAFDFNLKPLNKFKFTPDVDTRWLAGFNVRNNKLFVILYDRSQSFEYIKTNPQIIVNRYDFSTSKFEKSAEIKSDYIINYTKYSYRPEYLEFFYLSCSNSSSNKDAVLCVTRIDWNSMEVNETRSDFNPNAKLAKISNRPYLKNKSSNVFHYLVFRNPKGDGYKIMMRLATEKSATITQKNSSGGTVSSYTIYQDSFENTAIYDFDNDLNYTEEFELNNEFAITKKYFSEMDQINDFNGDYWMYTYKSDTTRQILFVNSHYGSKRSKLFIYEIKDGKMNTTPVIINDIPKKNCYYDLKHVHEIAPGVFVIFMTNDKRRSFFMIMNTN